MGRLHTQAVDPNPLPLLVSRSWNGVASNGTANLAAFLYDQAAVDKGTINPSAAITSLTAQGYGQFESPPSSGYMSTYAVSTSSLVQPQMSCLGLTYGRQHLPDIGYLILQRSSNDAAGAVNVSRWPPSALLGCTGD